MILLKYRHFIFPVTSYNRSWGTSIIGGYVYRGKNIKALYGFYLYADFYSGNIAAIKVKDNKVQKKFTFNFLKLQISRFAQDYKNELYICSFIKGKIYKLVGLVERKKSLEEKIK